MYDFPDQDGLLKALTTTWGATKVVKIPLSAFDIQRDPVPVTYEAGSRSMLLSLQGTRGSVVDASEVVFKISLEAEKPISGSCALILREMEDSKQPKEVYFGGLETWEVQQLGIPRLIDRELMNVKYKYPVPASCSAR